MYPRTASFDAAIQQSHRIATLATICPVNNPAVVRTLRVADGNITVDDVAIRRTATLDVIDVDGDMVPTSRSSLLAPRAYEVHLWRGVTYTDATQELVRLGIFTVTDFHLDDSGPSQHISLNLSDRAYRVSRALLTNNLQYTGATVAQVIQSLVLRSVPWVRLQFDAVTHGAPTLTYKVGDDPWDKAQSLAASIGCELYFDVYGTCILRQIPEYKGQAPVWSFVEGANCTMLYLNRQLTEQNSANWVTVIGNHPDNAAPFRGDAYDNNPHSPFYVNGPYGKVVFVEEIDSITSTAAATAAAWALFWKKYGNGELVRINAISHPSLEVGDIVKVVRGESQVNASYVIDKITIPLVHARPIDISMRQRLT